MCAQLVAEACTLGSIHRVRSDAVSNSRLAPADPGSPRTRHTSPELPDESHRILSMSVPLCVCGWPAHLSLGSSQLATRSSRCTRRDASSQGISAVAGTSRAIPRVQCLATRPIHLCTKAFLPIGVRTQPHDCLVGKLRASDSASDSPLDLRCGLQHHTAPDSINSVQPARQVNYTVKCYDYLIDCLTVSQKCQPSATWWERGAYFLMRYFTGALY